jgi:hypothetical protein
VSHKRHQLAGISQPRHLLSGDHAILFVLYLAEQPARKLQKNQKYSVHFSIPNKEVTFYQGSPVKTYAAS